MSETNWTQYNIYVNDKYVCTTLSESGGDAWSDAKEIASLIRECENNYKLPYNIILTSEDTVAKDDLIYNYVINNDAGKTESSIN